MNPYSILTPVMTAVLLASTGLVVVSMKKKLLVLD